MTEYDDPELERLVRASLDTHAGEVDTAVPVAARAREAARPHRGRWIAVGAAVAVAAAVAAVTVPVLVIDRHEQTNTVQPGIELPTQWRTEYWHNISVDVPAAWGWGVTPTRFGEQLVRCGDGGGAYVGRPIGTSDMCAEATGSGPYVWFGTPLEPGADGDQQTVEVEGERVTVASTDDELRARIVDSIGLQQLCPAATSERGPGLGSMPIDGTGDLLSFEMCAYALSDAGSYDLVYGAELDERAYQRWTRATSDPPPVDLDCPDNQELVVLKASFDDTQPTQLTWVVDLPCGQVRSGDGDYALTDEMTAPWADAGARNTLSYFIGPLG